MKTIGFFILLVAIIIGGLFLYSKNSDWSYNNIIEGDGVIEMNDDAETITMIFVGDIMLSRSVGSKMEEKKDWTWPFSKIASWLADADITFGNLEGPISNKGINVGSIYSFRANPKAIDGLVLSDFNILSVANNHMGDWGSAAFEDTLNTLSNYDIEYVGGGFSQNDAYSPVKMKVKDTQFCFFGYTDIGPRSFEASGDKSGMAFLDIEDASEDIEKYNDKCDINIVSLHFGEEYKEKASTRQRTAAASFSQAGADLIIGHHPHVISEVETIGDTQVFYSLGNFVFDQMFSEKTRKGMALVAEIKNKEIVGLVPHEIYINDEYQAELVSGNH